MYSASGVEVGCAIHVSRVSQQKAEIEKVMAEPVEKDEFKLRVESCLRTIDGVIHGAAMLAFLCCVPYAVFATYINKRVEALIVTKEKQ